MQWNRIPLSEASDSEEIQDGLLVSNPLVPLSLSSGIAYKPNFVGNAKEKEAILQDIADNAFTWDGFHHRRRVQRYTINPSPADQSSPSSSCPPNLLRLCERVQQASGGKRVDSVVVEEFPVSKWEYAGKYASHLRVTTFETAEFPDNENSEGFDECFVAQLALNKAAILHANKPSQRDVNCWDLATMEHSTDILMEEGGLVIKTGDFLWNWRTRLTADAENARNDEPVLIIRFLRLPHQTSSRQPGKTEFGNGYVPVPREVPAGPTPPLPQLLTIVITTSPIPSNPSTEVIERVLQTFSRAGKDFAFKCKKVIVCDGFRCLGQNDESDGAQKITKKHKSAKQAMRNGIVTEEQADRYRQFKQALRNKVQEAQNLEPSDDGSALATFRNVVVEELDERHGYGFALRHALRHCVSTPFVCVIQHDRTIMRPTPIKEVVHTLWKHPEIKYVGISMRSNLLYRDIFLGKYGKPADQELDEMTLRPPELLVDANEYGPTSNAVDKMDVGDGVRKTVVSLAETYQSSFQLTRQHEWLERNGASVPEGKCQMSLTPTLFWYDNVHVCETALYRDFVFHSSFKMVARGGFVEDKLSPFIVRTVERMGLKDGHAQFGCYLLDDHSGTFFTGHMDGGSFVSASQRKAKYASSSSSTS